MPPAPLLYIVDDDAEANSLLRQYLCRQGFEAVCLPNADELLSRLKRHRPDLVILDLMMPGMDGREALRRLRADGDDIPLILVTALSDEEDRIVGLDLGADDYVGKPFNPRELVSRIQAVLRRRRLPRQVLPEQGDQVPVGPCVLDPVRLTLTREGEPISMPPSDFALLRALVTNPLKPLSRDRLMQMIGQHSCEKLGRSIDVQIMRLRRLVERHPDNPTLLQTVRGVGYMFVPE